MSKCLTSLMANDAYESQCGLQQLIACAEISPELREAIAKAIDGGFTLCSVLPAIDYALLGEWIGHRWYLLHRHQLARMQQWSGIMSSRLNRTDADFALWPRWIESAVRSLARDGQTLLSVPGTSIFTIVESVARQAKLNRLAVALPVGRKPTATLTGSPGRWLCHVIDEITKDANVAYATLFLSPSDDSATPVMNELPLQDRLVVALSHHLKALSVRAGGNTDQLLGQRLRDDRFPLGTVSMRIPSTNILSDHYWLDQRAVGWYLPAQTVRPTTQTIQSIFTCRCPPSDSHNPALMPWTADARLLVAQEKYLIHCVRGYDVEAFRHGECAAVIDAIVQGDLSPSTPFGTLVKIASEQRIRASGKLLRTGMVAVSFTAVGLSKLMARRRYQSHLGRWDWEPFGLMIRRDALQRLGARPVIYGDDELFEQLDANDRPYFQPAHRRSARFQQEHWQAEEEWRLMDDVRLGLLPPESIVLFVQSSSQAQALAGHCPWPIIWLQADQTQPSPIAAARRRRSSARTSRN